MTGGRSASDSERRKRYRSLFFTYPRAWRAAHEDVVLDTLLDLHDDQGVLKPSPRERVRFALDGLRRLVLLSRKQRSDRRFAPHASLAPIPAFDQTNGVVADTRRLSEREQVHVNAAAGANSDEQRITPSAWFTLDAASRADRRERRRERRTDRPR